MKCIHIFDSSIWHFALAFSAASLLPHLSPIHCRQAALSQKYFPVFIFILCINRCGWILWINIHRLRTEAVQSRARKRKSIVIETSVERRRRVRNGFEFSISDVKIHAHVRSYTLYAYNMCIRGKLVRRELSEWICGYVRALPSVLVFTQMCDAINVMYLVREWNSVLVRERR